MKICLPGRRKVPEQVKEEVPDFTENKTSGDTFKKLQVQLLKKAGPAQLKIDTQSIDKPRLPAVRKPSNQKFSIIGQQSEDKEPTSMGQALRNSLKKKQSSMKVEHVI